MKPKSIYTVWRGDQGSPQKKKEEEERKRERDKEQKWGDKAENKINS